MTFFFTAFFMLMVFWRPQEWLVPQLYGLPILDAVVFMSLLALLLESDQGRIKFPTRLPQIYLLIGLWVAAILSHVAHTYFAGVMQTIPDVFKICFFTILLFCVLDRSSRLRSVAQMFVVMACFMAVHALLQEYRGYGFTGQRPLLVAPMWGRAGHTRSLFFGIFEDPNDMAQFLAASVPFAFAIQRRRTVFGWLLAFAVAAFLVRAIFATHSRGGMIGLAASVSVMCALLLPARWLPYAMGALLAGALILCPLSAGYLDISAHDRVVFWGLANDYFKSSPIFGIGYGMFWQVASDRAAHNAFVACYTTLGIVGYWFWFGLLHLGIVGAWRARRVLRQPENAEQVWMRRFAGLSIAAMTGFCASAYFLSRTFVYPMFFLFAMLGTVAPVTQRILPEDRPQLIDVRKDLFMVGSLTTAASIVYIYFSIVLLNRAFYGG